MFMLTFFVILEGECEKCLDNKHYLTHFWCTTTQQCMNIEQKQQCKNIEHHDLVLNATHCCSYITDQKECLNWENINFCIWCPEHYENNQLIQGLCLYKSDQENIKNNCQTQVDIVSPCSSYTSCQECSKDLPCTWCATTQKCTSKLFEINYGIEDLSKCEQNQMTWNNQYNKCLCQDNKYFEDNLCIQCPVNTTIVPDGSGCICKQYAMYNKSERKCQCIENAYLLYGVCHMCPNNAYTLNDTCVCIDKHAEFIQQQGKCQCSQEKNYYFKDGICIKCPDASKASDYQCVCQNDKQFDINTNLCVTLGQSEKEKNNNEQQQSIFNFTNKGKYIILITIVILIILFSIIKKLM